MNTTKFSLSEDSSIVDIFVATFAVVAFVAVSALPVTLPVRLPKNEVAVTELIPDIFVELSPIIFPFALIFPANVERPLMFSVLAFTSPIVEIPLIESALPTILSARTDPPVNSPKTVL